MGWVSWRACDISPDDGNDAPRPPKASNNESHQSIQHRQDRYQAPAVFAAVVMSGLALHPTWMSAASLRLGRALQGADAINVMDPAYGAKGDGKTNDRDAFQAAIDAAVEAGVPLYIPRPPQFYRIGLDPNHDRLLVAGDLAIVGDGRVTTTLRFTVNTTASGKNYSAFFVPGGVNFGIALGGTIVVEQVFALPGLGQLMINAIRSKDTPMVIAAVLFAAIIASVINLIVDIVYAYIDPRLR